MVRINRIYTRTGDDGTTALTDTSRVWKDSLRVAAYGEVDELNATLGLAASVATAATSAPITEKLSTIQNKLFDIGAELATPNDAALSRDHCVAAEDVVQLEQWIDEITELLPPLCSFVLPGGSTLNATLHLARCVCRRAERTVVTLAKTEEVSQSIRNYLNRLSDLLFALARYASHLEGTAEVLWVPGK